MIVYRIYSYDLKDGTTYRLTNNGFAVSPIYDSENDLLYYLSLTSEGYDLYRQRAEFAEYRFGSQDFFPFQQIPGSLEVMNISFSYGGYRDNLETLFPNISLPYLEYTDSGLSLGAIIQGMDALSHFSYYGLLGYNFGINRVEYQVNLDTRILSPLIVKLNAMNYNHVNELNLNLSYPFINNRTEGLIV